MPRLPTVAGLIGVLTGLWTLAISLFGGHTGSCPLGGCPTSGATMLDVLIIVLGIGLTFNSVVSFFWIRQVHYASAVLSALIAVAVYLNSSGLGLTPLATTTLLCLFSLAANLLAARSGTAMSEQGNPMNLPVFG